MVGRGSAQVNFFMSREDEAEFLRFAMSRGAVSIFPSHFPSREPGALDGLPDYEVSRSHSHQFYLFNRDVSSNFVVCYVEERGFGYIDPHRSSVVELWRSAPHPDSENVLVRGRIWAQFRNANNAMAYVYKEPEFEKWFDRLASWIRRSYEMTEIEMYGRWYAGPGALALRRQGWSLIQ